MDIEQRVMKNETIEINQAPMEFAIHDPYKARMEYVESKTDYLIDKYNKLDDEFFNKYCKLRLAVIAQCFVVLAVLILELLEVC